MITDNHHANTADNLLEFSVSELSRAVKRSIEQAFDRVRVRGEVGRLSVAASGHVYLSLKEDNAVLDCVCWSATVRRLSHKPETGLEVIATGRLTTYPNRSRYQLIIEHVEPAGVGALMALLEKRKKELGEEGLFDQTRKRQIPWLPNVVGVVTSPTGAVIRDILHRLRDRFPRHVLIWPVPVQGQGAAEEISRAIAGFNAIKPDSDIPRPDVLIVARGGGSIEDLWAFNEEIVVRAAAESEIPLISAVGHETDTTLIDFGSDKRAPTPTAAAEMAVPVRTLVLSGLLDLDARLVRAVSVSVERYRTELTGLARGLPRPDQLVNPPMQDLDRLETALQHAVDDVLTTGRNGFENLANRLLEPDRLIEIKRLQLTSVLAAMRPGMIENLVKRADSVLGYTIGGLERATDHRLSRTAQVLDSLSRRLENVSYRQVLRRGYTVIRRNSVPISRTQDATAGSKLTVEFFDGSVDAVVRQKQRARSAPLKTTRRDEFQGELFPTDDEGTDSD